MKVLEIEHLNKRYSPKLPLAIEDINIYANEGEIIGILGRNGVGKSTTIKCLTGIHPYESGTIKICDFDLSTNPIEAKAPFGYVPDVAVLFDKMTGIEYLDFIADIFKVSLEDRKARTEEFNKLFKLNDAINKQIKTYSHGMRQKISIMAALIHNPKLFVLDEPLTGLDPQTSAAVKRFMLKTKEQNNTVIFSSHNLDAVEQVCDRAYIIDKGKVIKEITLQEFRDNKESLEEYFLENVSDE